MCLPKHVPYLKPYVSIRIQENAGVKAHMLILTVHHPFSFSLSRTQLEREKAARRFPDPGCVLAQAIDFSWALGPCTSEESLSNSTCTVHGQFNINTASSHPDTLHAGMTKLKNLFIQQHVTSHMHDMMSTGKVSIDRDYRSVNIRH